MNASLGFGHVIISAKRENKKKRNPVEPGKFLFTCNFA